MNLQLGKYFEMRPEHHSVKISPGQFNSCLANIQQRTNRVYIFSRYVLACLM